MNRWATDIAALDARIDAAIAAVATVKHIELDANRPLLIGASMGATRAMQLAHRYAGKYTQLILIGAPEAPVANDLAGVRRVALLAGENEDQTTMRDGQLALSSAGIDAQFWELPEATHGLFGPDGAARVEAAVRYVTEAE
jgi:pimeloyl-ACP methyl ester carboxylesterase